MKRLASLKVTALVLIAFLLLTFWGVLGQANAEAAGLSAADAADRFFGSFFVWTLGVIPVPAFKSLAVIASLNLVASMLYRMPRVRGVHGGWRNLGLYGMHVALLVLLFGSLVGSSLRQEYNGYAVMTGGEEPMMDADFAQVKFFAAGDSVGQAPVDGALFKGWPYSVQYRGYVEMAPGKNVALYRAAYDPFHFVPYAFMFLFLLSAFFHYAVKVRVKRDSPRAGVWILALVVSATFAPVPASATENTYHDLPERTLSEPDDPVLMEGEVRSFDSFARGVLDEWMGKVSYKGDNAKYSASDILFFVQVDSLNARTFNLFKVLRSDVQDALNLPRDQRYVSYNQLKDSRGLLELYASRNDEHPATLEMKRLLANLQLYDAIERGDFKKSKERGRTKSEVSYNKMNFSLWAFIFAFIASLLSAVNLIFRSRRVDFVANGACMLSAAILAVLFAFRFYILGRPPLSSLYEIVLLISLLLLAFESGAFLLCKRRTFSLMIPVAFMAALLLFFAKFILEPGNLFQPIPAALNSSVFLTVHVFTIALGFAGMILSGVVAHLVLIRNRTALPTPENPKGSPLYALLKGTLAFGALFTIIGTLLGGVWADFAWGRFWGFDPKECGALFVILWAMLGLHLRVGHLVSARGFALFNSFNVMVTFLCWFGVNLLGVGLHSYGFQNGTAAWLIGFVMADCLVLLLVYRKKVLKR